jgi:hypothetical protein
MIGKQTGKVGYAVMGFGGFLSIYYPLPWSLLKYNPRIEGYEGPRSGPRAAAQHSEHCRASQIAPVTSVKFANYTLVGRRGGPR